MRRRASEVEQLQKLPLRACEGREQRVVPTGAASGGNEVKQRRDFSRMHFSRVAACGSRLDGHGGDAAWDGPSQCMLPGSGIGESTFDYS